MNILALNSGGFDSVVMLNYIREVHPDAHITTLFFDYGQKSASFEEQCSKKVSEKLKCEFMRVALPKFFWTSSDFYSPEFSGEKEYLEMRNLIFLSYALSVCESKGLDTLYMATLKSLGYYDTSNDFLDKIKSIAKDKGVEIITPFSECFKGQLSYLAYKYSITEEDFFSCDNPRNGSPCGECPDCKLLREYILQYTPSPTDRFLENFDKSDPLFAELIRKSKINEMRVYTNHKCQLKCSHCYYGYNKLSEPPLSLEEYRDLFTQARDLGINDYHFSGKEPLFDDSVFDVIKVLREVNPESEVSFVSNGLNVAKYIDSLKSVNPTKVCISVDDVSNLQGVRNVETGSTYAALNALHQKSIPVEVFIDLHQSNYRAVNSIINYLHSEFKVKNFYIRTIVPVGSASSIKMLSSQQLNEAYCLVREEVRNNKDIEVHFTISQDYMTDLLNNECLALSKAIYTAMNTGNLCVEDRLIVFGELYCKTFIDQITVTADGYVQGCASESCYKDYRSNSSGSIRNTPLKELISVGKESCIEKNKKNNGIFTCSCRNPLT